MYMSLDEMRKKLNSLLDTHAEVDKNTLVANAIVVHETDMELIKYHAPGTILFNCIDSMDNDKWYQLSVRPDRSSKWMM